MLMTHYREPIDFSVRKLEEAENTLRKWKRAADLAPAAAPQVPAEVVAGAVGRPRHLAAFQALTQLASKADRDGDDAAAASLKAALAFLGFDVGCGRGRRGRGRQRPIARRLDADRREELGRGRPIRDELLAQGIQLKDGKDPVTGERVTTWEVRR